jgi:hypothetical protein
MDFAFTTSSNFGVTQSKVQSIVRDQEGTWAVAKFNGEFLGAFSSGKGGGPSATESPHAEDHAIAALHNLLAEDGSSDEVVGHLTLKISKSPCIRCADRIIQLKNANSQLTIRIKALGLYFGKSVEDRVGAQLAMSRLMEAGIPVIRWDIETRYKQVQKGKQGEGALSGNPRAQELSVAKFSSSDFSNLRERRTVQFEGVQLATEEEYKGVRNPEATAEIQASLLRKHRAARLSQLPQLISELRKAVEVKKFSISKLPEKSRFAPNLWSHVERRREEVRDELMGDIAEMEQQITILTEEQRKLNQMVDEDDE